MIIFIHDEKEYEFRNNEDEVTLLELAAISDIMNVTDAYFEKWMRVISILGSKELAEVIDEEGVISIVEKANFTNVTNNIVESVEIKGRTYSTNVIDGKLKLSGKDLSLIEKAAKKGGAWIVNAFAIAYKDNDLTNTEHYTDAHIKHKAEIFGEHLTAKEGAPVFFQLQRKLTEHIQRISDAHAKTVS